MFNLIALWNHVPLHKGETAGCTPSLIASQNQIQSESIFRSWNQYAVRTWHFPMKVACLSSLLDRFTN